MAVPALNPLAAPPAICPTCGDLIQPEPVNVGKGKVTEILYVCVNPVKQCGWFVRATLAHLIAEGPWPLKPEEITKRREEREALAERHQMRETQVTELLTMVPRLKKLLADLEPDLEESAAPAGGQLQPPQENGAAAEGGK